MAEGETPAFLTRGYGGSLAGPVRVEPAHRADEVGDEPLLLARIAPTIVARDRVAGAEMAANASVIVMDDGFQNPSLAKDFSLVVIDGEYGIGNGHVVPAGPLRAPLAAQLARADALLVIGDAMPSARAVITAAKSRGVPVQYGRIVPDAAAVAALAGKKTLAFAGIAHPEKFFATLSAAGIAASVTRAFSDHHRYTADESAELAARAARDGLMLLTTEKDLARIAADQAAAPLAAVTALPILLRFADEGAVKQMVQSRLQSVTPILAGARPISRVRDAAS
jgi:tetraacyldisaccharide 4'-kinase